MAKGSYTIYSNEERETKEGVLSGCCLGQEGVRV